MTSGVFTFRTGLPLTIGETPDTSNAGSLAPRPDAIPNANLPRGQSESRPLVRPDGFPTPGAEYLWQCRRGNHHRPGYREHRLRAAEAVPHQRIQTVEFRAEAFNLFNTPLFQGVSRTFGSSTFGKVTSSQYERELEMGLKLYF